MHCAIKQHDEQARSMREDEFLKEFIAKYGLLYRFQDAMGHWTHDTFVQGAVVSQRKKIYDTIYRIEAEKI